MDSYEYKLKIQRDLNAVIETAYEDGIEAGRLHKLSWKVYQKLSWKHC